MLFYRLNNSNKENVRYQANVQAELAKHNTDLQVELRQTQLDAADAQQEASQATDVDKFNKFKGRRNIRRLRANLIEGSLKSITTICKTRLEK